MFSGVFVCCSYCCLQVDYACCIACDFVMCVWVLIVGCCIVVTILVDCGLVLMVFVFFLWFGVVV